MGDNDQLLRQRHQLAHDAAAVAQVQQRGGLVCDDRVRLDNQDGCECQHLLFPAGKRVRGMLGAISKAEAVKCLGYAAAHLVAREFEPPQRKGHVVCHARHDDLGFGVGEDESDAFANLFAVGLGRQPVVKHLARRRLYEPVDHADGG